MTDETDFEARHDARNRTLERVMFWMKLLAVVYLAAHFIVTWHAFKAGGLLAAAVTLVTLGFSDLFWALWSLQAGDGTRFAVIAFLAAVLCFASWYFRPRFNAWAMSMAADMLDDLVTEFPATDETDADEHEDEPDDPTRPANRRGGDEA